MQTRSLRVGVAEVVVGGLTAQLDGRMIRGATQVDVTNAHAKLLLREIEPLRAK